MKLEARDISVRFGGLVAVDRVSLTLAGGEILGLIGPNGAGKTTMVNVLSGFQPPHGGSVTIDGAPARRLSPRGFARAGVVRTFQAVRLFRGLSVGENVEVACVSAGLGRAAARARAGELLDGLGLGDKARLQPGALSYGDERRVGLARALALAPRYLLLDEPAAGLNVGEAEQLRGLIADIAGRFACGILVIEHNMSLVMRLCGRVQVLATGRTLASGPPADVMADKLVRQAYLGASAP